MGDPEEVVLFIRECLNMDTVLEVSRTVCWFICRSTSITTQLVLTPIVMFICLCQVIEEEEGPGAVKMEPQEDQ